MTLIRFDRMTKNRKSFISIIFETYKMNSLIHTNQVQANIESNIRNKNRLLSFLLLFYSLLRLFVDPFITPIRNTTVCMCVCVINKPLKYI